MAHDHICAPVRQLLGQAALGVCDGVTVLHAPVDAHHHKVGQLGCPLHLLPDGIGLAGVDDMGFHLVVGWDAVGVLGVGQIGDGDAVDGVHRDLPIVAAPQAGGDGVGRHRIPKPQSGGNSAAALVIGMVIGQAEHPETGPVERPGTISRVEKQG